MLEFGACVAAAISEYVVLIGRGTFAWQVRKNAKFKSSRKVLSGCFSTKQTNLMYLRFEEDRGRKFYLIC